MYIKTVEFDKDTLEYFDDLVTRVQRHSGEGYCGKTVDNMLKVSN